MKYRAGSVVRTHVELTANHMGYFEFDLCRLGSETEQCFQKLQFKDKTYKYAVKSGLYQLYPEIILDPRIKCDRCVLRWTYTAGNGWGNCADGSSGLGCGQQETFRSCADISIV